MDGARVVESAIEAEFGLPGSHGLFQQLLYYPPGAAGYVAHTDCRFDSEAAELANGGFSTRAVGVDVGPAA